MVTINNHSINENTECFYVKNFCCEVEVYEDSYFANITNIISKENFNQTWLIEENKLITPESILTDIVQIILNHTNTEKYATSIDARTVLN